MYRSTPTGISEIKSTLSWGGGELGGVLLHLRVAMRPLRAFLTDPLFWVIVLPVVLKLFVLQPVDLFEAHTIAVEWLRTGEFRYHHLGVWNPNYQFPIYSTLVAALLASGVGVFGVLVFQVLCGAASAWLVYHLARLVLDGGAKNQPTALLVALCTGLSPFIAVYQVRMVHPFALDMLFALALLTGAWAIRRENWQALIAYAALAGVALLNKPTAVVFLLPFVWRQRTFLFNLKHLRLKETLLILLVLPTGTWMVRNHSLLDAWSLNSATGQNLWLGVQEATDGTAQLADGRNYTALLDPADLLALKGMSPVEQSEFFTHRWKEEITEKPMLWFRMMGVKLRSFWLFRTHIGMQHAGIGAWSATLYKAYAAVVFVMLIIAMRFTNNSIRLLLITLFLYSMAQALFYVETRHRLVVEPVLMLVAIAGAAWLWRGSCRTPTPDH